jgi:hypothetical protein
MSCLPRLLRAAGLGLAVAALAAGALAPARASSPTGERKGEKTCATFAAFERAFEARSAADVAGLVADEGEVRVRLLGPPFSGKESRMKPAQAKRALGEWFDALQEGPTLSDVTAAEGPRCVRLYECTYRVRKSNATTTLLQVTVGKEGAASRCTLSSIVEKDRPR